VEQSQRVLLVRLRFAGGVLCVLVATVLLGLQAPRAFRAFNSQVRDNEWRTPVGRLVHTGDVAGIPHDFQEAALAYVPRRSTFAVLPPPSYEIAQKDYGIVPVTIDQLAPYLQFLLLPSRLVEPTVAEYVLCFACDTDQWDKRTTWLWKNTTGDAVGKVNGR
jgi:hypothetical protein